MAQKPVLKGRKPASQKPKQTPVNFEDVFGNPFKLDNDLVNEIKSKGLEYRMISEAQYKANSNRHPKKWSPYHRKVADNNMNDFIHGASPDGYTRVNGMILATRTQEIGDLHREFLKQRRDRMSGKHIEDASIAELKKMAQGQSKIQSGYDESEKDS